MVDQQLHSKRPVSIDDIAGHPRSVVSRVWDRLLQWGLQALREHNELRRWEQESDSTISRYR